VNTQHIALAGRHVDSVLRGPLADEAALHGVLIKVRDLALPLLALKREDLDISSQP